MYLRCPVEGCQGGMTSRTNPRVHFAHCHVRDTIVILEEGNRNYPHCHKFDMLVSKNALNDRQPYTSLCQQVEDQKHLHLAAYEVEAGEEMVITTYSQPLTSV